MTGIERDILLLGAGFLVGVLLTNLIYYLIFRKDSGGEQ